LALASLRSDWHEHKQLADGIPVENVFPKRSSFMGFHLLTPPRFMLRILQSAGSKQRKIGPALEIPFGPYGGLFIHKSALRKLGYPNERFYLYNDDSEYTTRFKMIGGRLFLVPASVVCDLDRSWHVLENGETLFSHLLLAQSDCRIYYATRNQSYLENHVWVKNWLIYGLNKSVFFLLLAVFAARHRKWTRLALIARAAREGKLGILNMPGAADYPQQVR
jgi:GT2 family glycosyltransferase